MLRFPPYATLPALSDAERKCALSRTDYYESSEAVLRFVQRYSHKKERAFCAFLASLIPAGSRVLEVGGGTGVHGRHLAVHFAYTHSDFSAAMCASARSFGLRSIRLDGLQLATAPVADAYVAIELSTLRDTDRSLRLHQLDAFADAVPLGATLVTSNGRGTMHTLDDERLPLGVRRVQLWERSSDSSGRRIP